MQNVKKAKVTIIFIKILFLISIFIAASNIVYTDVLFLNDGEEKTGNILKIQNNKIFFKTLSGKEIQYDVTSVSNIIVSKLREGDDVSHVSEIKDELVKEILKNLPQTSDFPESKYLVLYRKEVYQFNEDNTLTKDVRYIEIILKEDALDMGDRSVSFYSDYEKVELKFAHTYDPSGKVYHITDDAISEESVYSSTPEFDKLKKLRFSLKNVRVGSVIDFRVVKHRKIISHLNPFLIDIVFESQEPCLHREIIIKFPTNLNVLYKTYNWDKKPIPEFSESLDKPSNMKIYRWVYKNPKGYIPEPYMPSPYLIFPRILAYISSSWEEIALDLKKAISNAIDDDQAISEFIKELKISDSDNDIQKTIKVYRGIIEKIRYIAASFCDTNEFRPMKISVILKKRYANDYGRLVLAHALLNKLGIKSEIGFVGNWKSELVDVNVPNLGQSDYAILKVYIKNSIFYVTFISDYLPFGAIEDQFCAANAVFLANSNFYPEKIPADSSKNRVSINIIGKLDADGNIEVLQLREVKGNLESYIRSNKAQTEKERYNYVQKLIKNIHQNAILLDYVYSDLSDFSKPLTITYRYKIPEFAIKASDRILAFENIWNTNLSKYVSLATRTFPLELDYNIQEITRNITISIPEGYTVMEQSRSYSYQDSTFSYACDFFTTNNLLQITERLNFNNRLIQPGKEYKNFRNCVFKISELAKQWIILEKSTDSSEVSNSIRHKIDNNQDIESKPKLDTNDKGAYNQNTNSDSQKTSLESLNMPVNVEQKSNATLDSNQTNTEK